MRSAKALATVQHLHRGTPYVYQGEEFGMTNFPFSSIEDFQDIESLNHYREAVAAGQDPGRWWQRCADRAATTPDARAVGWDRQRRVHQRNPWLAVNPNYLDINAEKAVGDEDSVWHHYRKLITLRHAEPAVATGDFTMLLPEHEQIYAFTRRLGNTELLVLGNLSGEPADPGELPDWVDAELVLATWNRRRRSCSLGRPGFSAELSEPRG